MFRVVVVKFAVLAVCMFFWSVPAMGQLGGIKVETNWVFNSDAAHPGDTIHAVLEVKIQELYHVHSNEPLEDFLIPTILTVTPPEGFAVLEVAYPEPITLETDFSDIALAVFEEEFAIGVALEVGEDVAPGDYVVAGKLRYQACDDKSCLAPKNLALENTLKVVADSVQVAKLENPIFDHIGFTGSGAPVAVEADETPDVVVATGGDCDVVASLADFELLGTAEGYLKPAEFIQFIDDAETGTERKNVLEEQGPLAILLLVTLGGLALNLTPCVLPLIPINIAIIGAGAQAGSRARGFALGGTYGLAMAVVYGALGLVVILTSSAFGAINSTIWFNAGIAVLFVVLGLAMFDVINIDFSRFQNRLSMAGKAQRGTFALAFGMGSISALLAGACVAPVVIQVIVYSGDQYARGNTLALALPFFLGIGMALPWPFAGAGLSFLPKPGAWMVRVKQAMGVFILAFAAYYGHLGWEIFDSTRVDRDLVADAMKKKLEEGWTASICEGLETAKAEDKLVFVDMWATWCKNCLTMDKTTFKDEEVIARLDDYVKVKFQAQDLDVSPAAELLEHFDGFGLPTYAILKPKASE